MAPMHGRESYDYCVYMRVCGNIANRCLFMDDGGISLHNQIKRFLTLTIELTY